MSKMSQLKEYIERKLMLAKLDSALLFFSSSSSLAFGPYSYIYRFLIALINYTRSNTLITPNNIFHNNNKLNTKKCYTITVGYLLSAPSALTHRWIDG